MNLPSLRQFDIFLRIHVFDRRLRTVELGLPTTGYARVTVSSYKTSPPLAVSLLLFFSFLRDTETSLSPCLCPSFNQKTVKLTKAVLYRYPKPYQTNRFAGQQMETAKHAVSEIWMCG